MKDSPRHIALRKLLVKELQDSGIKDGNVLNAIANVPRHFFVGGTFSPAIIYSNRPLPIGNGQTISQPYTVAKQTELLEVKPGMKVLEIGTGSGYQAAILAYLGANVYSVERIPELAEKARKTLQKLGFNVKIKVGDGTKGWEEFAPYDRIIVTAGAPDIPKSLLEQLKTGGIMVIPAGTLNSQKMWKIVKTSPTTYSKIDVGNYTFVPLIGEEGWQDGKI